MPHIFQAPTVCNVEITEACNQKCRHCYNHWRQDDAPVRRMSRETMDRLLDRLEEAGVFHVVLSGGEPFMNFEVLEHGLRQLVKRGMSISCNSNLALATDDRIKRLRDLGLDHILTSLNSHDPATNDFMVHQPGAFKRIIKGIETARRNDVRVSVNMILSKANLGHIRATGRLAHELGCQKIFGTRTVPPAVQSAQARQEFHMGREESLEALNAMVEVKEETGIMIGTLVSYPLCLLSDLVRFRDFVGRGCPAQTGHCMNISVDGEAHACVHQQQGYGNVFTDGLREVYGRMHPWYAGEYLNPECSGCAYVSICKSGCRSTAHALTGSHQGRDPLMVHKDNFTSHFHVAANDAPARALESGARFIAPRRLRFRKEDGFYLLNVRWANTITCPTDVAEKLLRFRDSGESFSLDDFGSGHKDLLAQLFSKDAIESSDVIVFDKRHLAGLSADIQSSEGA